MAGNTRQHSFRATRRLWNAYSDMCEGRHSNASIGLRNHMIEELDRAGLLTPDLLEPDPDDT
jgi:hypothetical protein